MNADGKMDKKEFSIAMHMIQKKLQGFEVPKVLPQTILVEPGMGYGGMGAPMGEWFLEITLVKSVAGM